MRLKPGQQERKHKQSDHQTVQLPPKRALQFTTTSLLNLHSDTQSIYTPIVVHAHRPPEQ